MARYSASAEERETTDCFLDFQSASQCVTKFVPPFLGKKMPCPGVALRCRRTRMTASKWLWRGSETNWLSTLTRYVISGFVAWR
ncbi:hypothetical protein Hanom_Chr04g00374221 [Helianthus anomalus]